MLQIKLLSQKAPNTFLDDINKEFSQKLNRNSIFIVVKFQLYSSTYNSTYFKYSTTATG